MRLGVLAWRHGVFEAVRIARHPEQALLTLVLPLAVAFSGSRILNLEPASPLERLPTGSGRELAAIGAIAVALASSAFASQAVHTAFESKYGSMRLMGTTPLGGRGLVLGKIVAVGIIATAQVAVLAAVSLALGWRPIATGIPVAALAAILAIASFVSLALILAGTVRAEWTLGIANLVWAAMVGFGGLMIPLAFNVPAHLPWLAYVPPGALGETLRASLIGTSIPWGSVVALAAWAAILVPVAARTFRWSARS